MIKDLEFRRQILHIIVGLVTVFLILNNILTTRLIFFLILFGGVLSFLCMFLKIPVLSTLLDFFQRKNEKKIFPGRGIIFFFVGVLLVLKLFDRDIALASIMVLTFGDSISHLVGVYVGKIKHPLNCFKCIEGTIVGIFAGFFGALFFVPLLQAFFGSFVAMIIEAVEFKMSESPVDDNLLIPLVAGTVIYLIATGFAIFY